MLYFVINVVHAVLIYNQNYWVIHSPTEKCIAWEIDRSIYWTTL